MPTDDTNDLEDKIVQDAVEERKDQPTIKVCPLCDGELIEVVSLLNSRRIGRIKGQREYSCKDCGADIAIHFSRIERLQGRKDPVFSKPKTASGTASPCVACGKPSTQWTPRGEVCDDCADDGTGGTTT